MRFKNSLNDALLIPAVLTGAVFALQSAWYGYSLLRPVIFGDQIASVDEYLVYLDGNYTWHNLIRLHNEHRIATSRVMYLIDAIHFDMTNRFLIPCIYLLLLGLTASLAALAPSVRSPLNIAIATTVALGIGWSTSQYENLSWGFQTQFPFVHLFALACIVCLVKMMDRGSDQRAGWFALAIAADALGIVSSASGVLIGLCIVPVCLWLGSWNRWALAFLAIHIAMMATYFIGFPGGSLPAPTALDFVRYFFRCLGAVARENHPMLFGLVLFGATAGLIATTTWHSIVGGGSAGKTTTVLLAFATFIILEVMATTIGRAGFGLHQAIASRYATQSAMLVLATLALYWRMEAPNVKAVTLVAAIAISVLANAPANLARWNASVARKDALMVSIVNGDYSPEVLNEIFQNESLVERDYKLLEKLKKGPFAEPSPYLRH